MKPVDIVMIAAPAMIWGCRSLSERYRRRPRISSPRRLVGVKRLGRTRHAAAGAGAPIGGMALHPAPDGALEARMALHPDRRTHTAAYLLVGAAQREAQFGGSPLLRLALPGAATWTQEAAAAAGLIVARATLVMRRPAARGPRDATAVSGITIRTLVHALNHAWAGTWNFRPLTRHALERDLTGQWDGFLIAIDSGPGIAPAKQERIWRRS